MIYMYLLSLSPVVSFLFKRGLLFEVVEELLHYYFRNCKATQSTFWSVMTGYTITKDEPIFVVSTLLQYRNLQNSVLFNTLPY